MEKARLCVAHGVEKQLQSRRTPTLCTLIHSTSLNHLQHSCKMSAAALIQEQELQLRAQSYYPENVAHNAKQVE